MLRIIQEGANLPIQYTADTSAVFQAGSAAMLTVIGSSICATVSNGMAFLGVFDDVKTRSFSQNSWDEEVIVAVGSNNLGLNGNNQLITLYDIKAELLNPNVITNSFVSTLLPVQLIPRNGVVVFPAGTVLNYDLLGTGTPNALKTLVRYSYQIPNIIGNDTTFASQQITVWFSRMIFETDQIDTTANYQVNSNIFVNSTGLFTTTQIHPNSPAVAICLAPPTSIHSGSAQFLLL